MEFVEPLNVGSWEGPFPDVKGIAVSALEDSRILYADRLPFVLTQEEQRFLSDDCLDAKSKNVSFRPASGELQGTGCEGADRERLLGMLRRYHQYSRTWITAICPAYRHHLKDGFTTFRPADIARRVTSWRKDDTRLHVDAFPSRPLKGRRILRVFTNVNLEAPRIWRIGENFEQVAARFLPKIKRPIPGTSWLLYSLKLVKDRRTLYDHYMLGLHDLMKSDEEYQARSQQVELSLAPGSSWACFTDSVPHAAMSGQFAFEQTFYLPVDAMREPARSPLRILERLIGRPLL
jgi:hypothetical protein